VLQNYGSSKAPVLYFVFDVMMLAGEDVMDRPLTADSLFEAAARAQGDGKGRVHRPKSWSRQPVRDSGTPALRHAFGDGRLGAALDRVGSIRPARGDQEGAVGGDAGDEMKGGGVPARASPPLRHGVEAPTTVQ
jgi:hypothetical protein